MVHIVKKVVRIMGTHIEIEEIEGIKEIEDVKKNRLFLRFLLFPRFPHRLASHSF